MGKHFRLICVAISLFLTSIVSAAGRPHYACPTLIPGTTPEMRNPGFWIGRLSSPDAVILSDEEIQRLNRKIREELKSVADVGKFPEIFDRTRFLSEHRASLQKLQRRQLYREDGRLVPAGFFRAVRENVAERTVPETIPVRFELVVRHASQRILPTSDGLYAMRYDSDFDELQNSTLEVGTPVALLHRTRDGRWTYAVSPSSSGWIPEDAVAYCSREEIERFCSRTPFVVVTAGQSDLYFDAEMTQYGGAVRMGTRLPSAGGGMGRVSAAVISVRGPEGQMVPATCFLRSEDVSQGYLPFTQRNAVRQAFRCLDAPYGWGGTHVGQDCSGFIQEIFATMGLVLPRNSSDQQKTGTLLADWKPGVPDSEKTRVLSEALPGASILYMKGHIMLFLGVVDGVAYAIHAVWAYREGRWWGDRVRVINRVEVTDLLLGRGSRKGSFLSRLLTVRTLGPESPKGAMP